ncbi:MAG: site-specific integrase [Treponema sp.]|nr:site-specific integrase [Treponema sp.]
MGKSVHIRNRNGRLYIEVYLYGRQTRRSLGLRLTGDKIQDRKIMRLAEIIRSRREMQLACAEWGIPDMVGNEKSLCMYIEENYQKCGNYTLGRCLHYLKKYRFGSVSLRAVTPQWVEDFQAWLIGETGLSQGTASLYSSALRHQLRLAVRDRLLSSSPAEFVRNIAMPESRKQPLSVADLRRLAEIEIKGELGEEVRRAFLFSCFTGLRVSDLKSLRWCMVREHDDGSLWIHKSQKKTGQAVFIPLNGSAIFLMRKSDDECAGGGGVTGNRAVGNGDDFSDCVVGKDGNDFVFPRLAATKANTDQYLSKWGLKAGIKHVSWHTARHTMATIALEHGAELRTVSELLGHSDLSTTLRYAKATDSLKKSAVDALPDIFSSETGGK